MKLYIYDHCPYCVKARMIFGFKGINIPLVTLLNDDAQTPTRMIGIKMVPILEKDDGTYMPESMDIVRFIDKMDGKGMLAGRKDDEALGQWLEDSREYLYKLAMPRWVRAPLEEFRTESARRYFTVKKEPMIGDFVENMENTPALTTRANAHLKVLENIIQSSSSVHEDMSEDDIHLFTALRSLSIVKGLSYPKKVEAYRAFMAERSGIPLHDDIAL